MANQDCTYLALCDCPCHCHGAAPTIATVEELTGNVRRLVPFAIRQTCWVGRRNIRCPQCRQIQPSSSPRQDPGFDAYKDQEPKFLVVCATQEAVFFPLGILHRFILEWRWTDVASDAAIYIICYFERRIPNRSSHSRRSSIWPPTIHSPCSWTHRSVHGKFISSGRPRGSVGIAALLCRWQTTGGGSIPRWSASKTQDRRPAERQRARTKKKGKFISSWTEHLSKNLWEDSERPRCNGVQLMLSFVVCQQQQLRTRVSLFWVATNSFGASFCELRHSGFSPLSPWQTLFVVVFVGPCPVCCSALFLCWMAKRISGWGSPFAFFFVCGCLCCWFAILHDHRRQCRCYFKLLLHM